MYSIIQNKQYIILFFIYIISFALVLLINKILSTEHSYSDGLYKYMYECIYYNESPICKKLTSTRGSKYYTISGERKVTNDDDKKLFEKNQSYCIVSLWALLHIILYIIIGFYCPNLFIPSLIIGALFEYFENLQWDCHDALDVAFNSFGFGIGYVLNKIIFKNSMEMLGKSIIFVVLLLIIMFITMFNNIKKYQNELK